MAQSQAPYIHVILADIVSITLYINKPLVRLTTVHYQSAVSMISFAQVLTVQWSDTIPCRNVQFKFGITSHDIPFQHICHQPFLPPPSNLLMLCINTDSKCHALSTQYCGHQLPSPISPSAQSSPHTSPPGIDRLQMPCPIHSISWPSTGVGKVACKIQ